MVKNNIIIISTFPNTLEKISFLQEQLYYFSKLKIPILVISGCDIPAHLNFMIDYLIINKENEKIEKDFMYKCIHELNLDNTAVLWVNLHPVFLSVYTHSMNSTITKNIKLALKMAKNLGYKNVFFTEDDNVFKDGSFDFIKKQFDILNEEKIKLITARGILNGSDMLYITYFFANLDFILEKYTIPHDKKDWYIAENIIKYDLNKAYEILFYNLFKNDMDKFLNINDELIRLRESGHIDDGKSTRLTNEKWILDNIMNVFVDKNKNKYLILLNMSYQYGNKEHRIQVYFDNNLSADKTIVPSEYFISELGHDVKQVRIKVDDVLDKTIDVDYELVKFNGLLHLFNQN